MQYGRKLLVVFGALGVALLSFGSILPIYADKVSDIKPTSYVTDRAGVIDAQSRQNLEQKLETINKTRNAQGAVVVINNLDGQDIQPFATDLFRQIGIGSKEKNNGFLVLISIQDRKSRIEVGYGAEGVITDARSGRILAGAKESFGAKEYGVGLTKIVNDIDDLLSGDPDTAKRLDTQPSTKGQANWVNIAFFALFFAVPWLAAILGRSKSWWAGGVVGGGLGGVAGLLLGAWWAVAAGVVGGLIFDYFISKNYRESDGGNAAWWAGGGWLGGGSGGSDGGGFGGFGGGSSGGGGASGDW